MKIADIKRRAYAMPFDNPSYSRGPYRFHNREFLIIRYETEMEALREIVPEPLEVVEPHVNFEVIAMPDSQGFGCYTESGQVIPVHYQGKPGNYVHSMYLDDVSPIVSGREIWGFPKKYGTPHLKIGGNKDTICGTLDYGHQRIATATMGYKYENVDIRSIEEAMALPNYLIKVIPHVDGTARICELVRYFMTQVTIKGAWSGPSALELHSHALAPLSKLPVKRIISSVHFISDLTLDFGEVVFDYLNN
ncbi:MAG: acetoacetate decarboxylase [Chlamydiia bacterium]|nr:acetoacetate decarboxylase [Chlamydiia bacterium]